MTISNDTTIGQLLYFTPPLDGSKPYIYINDDGTRPQRNYQQATHEVKIENIRGKEDSVSLDKTGFQFYNRPAAHKSFQNDEEIEKEYYPESIALLKELTGASLVVPFDHTIRRRRPGELDDSPQKRQPVPQVHIDQTPTSSRDRVRRHLPAEDVPRLLANRFQIINLWRPIGNVALDWPLALCDGRSVDEHVDLIPTTLKYPDRDGETFSVKFNPNHRWKYLRGMTPDEVVLIKCYDSKEDPSLATFTPHTAFEDPSTPADAPLRQSIEVRFLVFYD
ncbi:uncharacterized protein BXZ73DRAFT_41715 [Epithele typhae]|uniref:uncharacterized protein n=1 Tax=Epithele typhae TaxID=378194 RepID=UPI002008293B|nr:uncharacterized protein BXZ73DRAFT_41715 [Epithele typhae]KAH9941899.1 hypothetical protein BXZ73DRAFT_41715 [Epithele typhae]